MKHLAAALVLVLAITGSDQAADPPVSGAPERMPGLEAAATITIDDNCRKSSLLSLCTKFS